MHSYDHFRKHPPYQCKLAQRKTWFLTCAALSSNILGSKTVLLWGSYPPELALYSRKEVKFTILVNF